MNAENRRSFFKRASKLAGLPLFGGGAYGYGALLERHRVTVEQHEVKLALGDRAPRKLRALALGDFHYDPLFEAEYVAHCVNVANSLNPDVVFLTGDYVTRSAASIGELAGLLSKLTPRHGIVACLGNHDHWTGAARVTGAMKTAGIEVLVNQHTRLACGDGELVVAGLHSAWAGTPSWAQASRGLRSRERAIVLAHEPDFARTLCKNADVALQVSGHTHGGQVRIPWFGALRLPNWGRLFQSGFYDLEALKLHVNRGIGTISIHVRFCCPPEIACFDITNTGAVA